MASASESETLEHLNILDISKCMVIKSNDNDTTILERFDALLNNVKNVDDAKDVWVRMIQTDTNMKDDEKEIALQAGCHMIQNCGTIDELKQRVSSQIEVETKPNMWKEHLFGERYNICVLSGEFKCNVPDSIQKIIADTSEIKLNAVQQVHSVQINPMSATEAAAATAAGGGAGSVGHVAKCLKHAV